VSPEGVPGRTLSPVLLLFFVFSIAAHGLGWMAWKSSQSGSAAQEWMLTRQRAQPAVRVHLSAPPSDARPVENEAVHAQPIASRDLRRAATPPDSALSAQVFVPASELDAPVVPMSAPDTSRLDGLGFSGFPIRLRLLIAADGQVLDVLTLQSAPEDAQSIEQIKAMLQDTAYIPGRLQGKPVRTQLDLELKLSNVE